MTRISTKNLNLRKARGQLQQGQVLRRRLPVRQVRQVVPHPHGQEGAHGQVQGARTQEAHGEDHSIAHMTISKFTIL